MAFGINALHGLHGLNDDELNIPRRRDKLRAQRYAEDGREIHPDGLRDKRLALITRVK